MYRAPTKERGQRAGKMPALRKPTSLRRSSLEYTLLPRQHVCVTPGLRGLALHLPSNCANT